MRVLVSGASGFIGRHVLRALRERPVEVVALSRRPQADAPSDRLRWFDVDIGSSGAATRLAELRCDVLIHLAWAGLPNYRSLHHFETELPSQYSFLAGLARSGLRRMLATGTCFEYGMQSGSLHEALDTRPGNPYALAKDTLRRQLQFLQTTTPFDLTWARLFYCFGEGQSPSSLYAQYQAAATRGDDIFAMSKGEQLRDFLPVETLAATIVDLALGAPPAGVVNVCSGVPTSVRALVEAWQEGVPRPMRLDLGRMGYADYEPLAFWGDRSKLDSILTSAVPGMHHPT